MNNIVIKTANFDINKELNSINFDSEYINNAKHKYQGKTYKLFYLKPHEANILKQMCLSLGFDCAVSRDTIMCNCEYTNCILFASFSQIKKLIEKLKNQPFRLKQVAELLETQIDIKIQPLIIRNYCFDWSRPYIMGVLNVTPDSFSDGGKYNDIYSAVSHVQKMIEDGADIIDIGGEATNSNAGLITYQEEINRIIPVLDAIRKKNINIPISIDTRNYSTAKAAIESGADIINDVSGFSYDKNLLNYVCENNIASIIMHSDKVPASNIDFKSSDIIEEIYLSLYNKINVMLSLGQNKSNIIADVGIGFGKSKESCFEILKRHNEFEALKVPMLLGLSRKSFIRNEFNIDCYESDIPTALYSSILSNRGVNIHRVHNVALTKQFLNYSKI